MFCNGAIFTGSGQKQKENICFSLFSFRLRCQTASAILEKINKILKKNDDLFTSFKESCTFELAVSLDVKRKVSVLVFVSRLISIAN